MIGYIPLAACGTFKGLYAANKTKDMNEQTSKKVSSIAGRVLSDPCASKENKRLAASALTQAADKITKHQKGLCKEKKVEIVNKYIENALAALKILNEASRHFDIPIKQIVFKANKRSLKTTTKIQYW